MATSKKRAPAGAGKKHTLKEITAAGEDDGTGGTEPAKPITPGVKKVPLGELGNRLPVGAHVGGALIKDLATRPWKTKDDRELGKQRKKGTSPAQYIGMILRQMCTTLGDYKQADFPGDDDKALIKIGQLFAADVFFAYVRVRIEALGPELPLQVSCGACDHGFKYVGILDTVDTYCVDDPRDMFWEFSLRDGAEIRGKEVKGFIMGPPRWNLMDEALRVGRNGKDVDVAAVKLATARHSIYYLGDDNQNQVQLAEVELDDVSKFDIESLMSEINTHSLGPNMSIEGECPRCKTAFQSPINWEDNDFFSISSRS